MLHGFQSPWILMAQIFWFGYDERWHALQAMPWLQWGSQPALMMKSPWLEVRENVVMTGPGYVWWNYCVSSNSQLFKFEVLDES